MDLFATLTKGVRRSKQKVAVFVCGAPGSGKSTHIQDMIRTTYVSLNADTLWNLTKDPHVIKQLDTLFTRLIQEGYSFVYEGTCRDPTLMKQRMKRAREHGYIIKLQMIYADLPTLLRRVRARTTQPTPPSVIKEAFLQLQEHAHEYMDHADEVWLYNHQKTSRLIFFKSAQKVVCHSPSSSFYFDVSAYCD